MDLCKTGEFLRRLRTEKGLSQEQLADQLGVARRTVSRWETGTNAPDLDILIRLSDFYGVGLRDILDGERKDEPMSEEIRETAEQIAEYSSGEKARLLNRTRQALILGMAGFAAFVILLLLLTGTARSHEILAICCITAVAVTAIAASGRK